MVLYLGKKSIISGKNDSPNKRLATRIVNQYVKTLDAIECFRFLGLHSAYEKSAFFLQM